MGRSSVQPAAGPGDRANRIRLLRAPRDEPPVYTYERVPGMAPVSVVRFLGRDLPPGGPPRGHAHAHDFVVLAYFARGGGSLRLSGRQWRVRTGDVYLVAPGEVIGAGDDTAGLATAEGCGVYFPPEVLRSAAPGELLSWRAHPLLYPFVGTAAGGAQRLSVPAADRAGWSDRLAALEGELVHRRDGHREAVLAHLTLLLVEVSRLAADVAGDLRLRDEPLLAEVFEFVERRYRDRISLSDVAGAVGLSPGHLTTVVRRRTGRTVGAWITERRMVEARTLLVQTDLPVAEVGRRVGYDDAGYFTRTFRRVHGATPLGWRHAAQA